MSIVITREQDHLVAYTPEGVWLGRIQVWDIHGGEDAARTALAIAVGAEETLSI